MRSGLSQLARAAWAGTALDLVPCLIVMSAHSYVILVSTVRYLSPSLSQIANTDSRARKALRKRDSARGRKSLLPLMLAERTKGDGESLAGFVLCGPGSTKKIRSPPPSSLFFFHPPFPLSRQKCKFRCRGGGGTVKFPLPSHIAPRLRPLESLFLLPLTEIWAFFRRFLPAYLHFGSSSEFAAWTVLQFKLKLWNLEASFIRFLGIPIH